MENTQRVSRFRGRLCFKHQDAATALYEDSKIMWNPDAQPQQEGEEGGNEVEMEENQGKWGGEPFHLALTQQFDQPEDQPEVIGGWRLSRTDWESLNNKVAHIRGRVNQMRGVTDEMREDFRATQDGID